MNVVAWLLCLIVPASLMAQDHDVPFVTTPDPVVHAMLDIAKVTAADYVIDLGSGDGRIVITAARRHGASGLGVDIDAKLVAQSVQLAQRAGVAERARFLTQDLFATDLRRATVVTMYLLPEVNLQLRPSLLKLAPGTRVVSHDWDMGDWPPDAQMTVPVPDKKLGRAKESRVYLWVIPAQIGGQWCQAQERINIEQRYQSVRIMRPGSKPQVAVFSGIDLRRQGQSIGKVVDGVLTLGSRLYRRCP
jgi:SAM-dependent methyltransferase